jgi:hypothetical protein
VTLVFSTICKSWRPEETSEPTKVTEGFVHWRFITILVWYSRRTAVRTTVLAFSPASFASAKMCFSSSLERFIVKRCVRLTAGASFICSEPRVCCRGTSRTSNRAARSQLDKLRSPIRPESRRDWPPRGSYGRTKGKSLGRSYENGVLTQGSLLRKRFGLSSET